MPLEILDADDVRRIVREELTRPCFVHQRNVEAVLGLPNRDFLRACHANAFPWTKQARLLIAKTTDVAGWLESRIATSKGEPANDADAETISLARVGARRVEPGMLSGVRLHAPEVER